MFEEHKDPWALLGRIGGFGALVAGAVKIVLEVIKRRVPNRGHERETDKEYVAMFMAQVNDLQETIRVLTLQNEEQDKRRRDEVHDWRNYATRLSALMYQADMDVPPFDPRNKPDEPPDKH